MKGVKDIIASIIPLLLDSETGSRQIHHSASFGTTREPHSDGIRCIETRSQLIILRNAFALDKQHIPVTFVLTSQQYFTT